MSETLHHVLWLLPPDEVRERFARLINDLAEANDTPVFDPHITLLEGLDGEEDLLRAHAQDLAAELRPLELRLTETDYLDEFHRALFIRVEPVPALLAARAAAQKRFATMNKREFMPHMSLLYGKLTVPVKESLLDGIGRQFDLPFRVNDMLLVAIAGPQPGDWRYVERFRLGCDAS